MGFLQYIGKKIGSGLGYIGRKLGSGLGYIASKSDVIRSALNNPLTQAFARAVPYGEKILKGANKGLDIAQRGKQAIDLVNQFVAKPPVEQSRGELEKQMVPQPPSDYQPPILDLD